MLSGDRLRMLAGGPVAHISIQQLALIGFAAAGLAWVGRLDGLDGDGVLLRRQFALNLRLITPDLGGEPTGRSRLCSGSLPHICVPQQS